jgi:hypothetical protein
VPDVAGASTWIDAIVKLIPAETLVIYTLLSSGVSPSGITGKALITAGTVASVFLLAWLGNVKRRKRQPAASEGWLAAAVFSATALVLYLFAYPDNVFNAAGLPLRAGVVIAAIGGIFLPKIGDSFDVQGLKLS